MNKFIAYLHFGSGDIFESREFVREYVRKFSVEENYFAHGKPAYLLKDLHEVQFTDVTPDMDPRVAHKTLGETVLVNMWIGRDSKYVLPNIGVVVEQHYRMHNDILKSLGLPLLTNDVYSYVPRINYSEYAIDGVDAFVKTDKRLILISNGPVHSSQAKNFDFTPVINMLCDTFPEYMFITTQGTPLIKENLISTSEIIKVNDTDLNEISYLSTFCDVCIGRNSGPHVFAQVLDNWLDKDKISLSFTYGKGASHFVASDTVFPMRKEWSNAEDTDGVFRKICEVLA